ncbi:unnamed protein product, partial [Brassica oleracea]|uniref:Uncharacterized protein n=1 Tax=Brassica oleracea TaxID=3712 RepID=A0A3P6B293_BRAOL|nr:unnamed protein product [Brassica oleracea]
MASWTWSIKLAIGRVGCTSGELDVARAIGICNRLIEKLTYMPRNVCFRYSDKPIFGTL